MKYYARINKSNVGPLSLKELVEAGIRPSTYVWTRGMEDWQRADENPDVCRAMRRYLAGLDPITGRPIGEAEPAELSAEVGNAEETQQDAQHSTPRSIPEPPDMTNYSIRPQGVSVAMALLMTVMCFPLTGLVALFYAMRCKADWTMSENETISSEQREKYRRKAHEDARIYRMMIGITFFIGLIWIGVVISRQSL